MLELAIQVLLAPGLAAAATLAARRWGERAAGRVSAFPAIVGPLLLVVALRHSPAFTARVAGGVVLGLVSLAGFALAYGRAAVRAGWGPSLLAGWGAAAALAAVAGASGAGAPAGLGLAAGSLMVAWAALPRAAGPPRRAPPPGARCSPARWAPARSS